MFTFSTHLLLLIRRFKTKASSVVAKVRMWEPVDAGVKTGNFGGEFRKDSPLTPTQPPFTVLNYNVLSPALLMEHPNLYDNCDPRFLSWPYRLNCFFNEISSYKPDIVCLQEVELACLGDYDRFFSQNDYFGHFKKRTGDKNDGCAIFVKNQRFKVVDACIVEYYQPETTPLLNRHNIGLIVRTEDVQTGNHLVVGTTHLLFNRKRTDVKLAQAKMFLDEVERMASANVDMGESYCPAILTGDFNVELDSPVLSLFTEGKNKENQGGLVFKEVYGFGADVDNPFVTTRQGRWTRVDYMYYFSGWGQEDKGLKLVERLQLPKKKDCEAELLGIPAKGIPSDHLSLGAKFRLV